MYLSVIVWSFELLEILDDSCSSIIYFKMSIIYTTQRHEQQIKERLCIYFKKKANDKRKIIKLEKEKKSNPKMKSSPPKLVLCAC